MHYNKHQFQYFQQSLQETFYQKVYRIHEIYICKCFTLDIKKNQSKRGQENSSKLNRVLSTKSFIKRKRSDYNFLMKFNQADNIYLYFNLYFLSFS